MTDHADRAWALAREMDICMLVTHASEGFHSRPMSSIVDRDEGKIRFIADAKAGKDDEIRQNPDVLLAYSNGSNKHVSIKGPATISKDRALIKRLWSPGAQAFFPAGPDAADVVVIEVSPTGAEYWDGNNAVVSAVKFVAALATGATPAMGDSAKTDL